MDRLIHFLFDLVDKYCDEPQANYSCYPKSKEFSGNSKIHAMTKCYISIKHRQEIMKYLQTSVCKEKYPIYKWKDEIDKFNLCTNDYLYQRQTYIKDLYATEEQQQIEEQQEKQEQLFEDNKDYLSVLNKNLYS